MTRVLLLLAVLAAASRLVAAPPAAPGPELTVGLGDAPWRDLFARLASGGAVWSRFTEARVFPFHAKATVLEGEMRYDPKLGLSLHYLPPHERTLIVDAQGMLERDEHGRTRALPADAHVVAINRAMLAVLRFDPAEIEQSFTVRAARDGDDWRLDLAPRDETLAHVLGTLIVSGHGEELQRLEFRRSEKQHVTIAIGETRRGLTFDAGDRGKYFR